MINFTKLTIKKVPGLQRPKLPCLELLHPLRRTYLNVSPAESRGNRKSERIDLRKEFQELIKENPNPEDKVRREETKTQQENLNLQQTKTHTEDTTEKLKGEWENKRSDEEEKEKCPNDSNDTTGSSNNQQDSNMGSNNVNMNMNNNNNNKNNSDKTKSKNKNSDKNKSTEETVNPFSKFIQGFVRVWNQTFPGEQNVDLIFENRKREAQLLKSKIKEPTEEEIAAIEASIPEWKRGALVLIADQPDQEKLSIFEAARRNLKIHVKNLKIYQDSLNTLQNSEIKLLVEDLKTSYTNVRENISESQNPFFVVSRDLIDRVPFKSPSAAAITVMRKYDPNFDLILFEKEVDAIFKQLLTAFVKDDLDLVRLICGETALAVLTSEIRSRRERNIECKYKELLYVDHAQYVSANVQDEDNCTLRFRISSQEINCKISRKDGQVVEGNVDMVENIQYVIDITRNPEPVVEEVGHPYLVVGLERVGVMRQIL